MPSLLCLLERGSGCSLQATNFDLFIAADGVWSPLMEAISPGILEKRRGNASPVIEILTCIRSNEIASELGDTFRKITDREDGVALGILSPKDDEVIAFAQINTEVHGNPGDALGTRLL